MRKDNHVWYSENWGEPLDVALSNGKILHFACEFYRGDGWRITDRETGMLARSKRIPTKKVLTEYINDKNFLEGVLRATSTEYYETQKDELKQFLESITRPMSL